MTDEELKRKMIEALPESERKSFTLKMEILEFLCKGYTTGDLAIACLSVASTVAQSHGMKVDLVIDALRDIYQQTEFAAGKLPPNIFVSSARDRLEKIFSSGTN